MSEQKNEPEIHVNRTDEQENGGETEKELYQSGPDFSSLETSFTLTCFLGAGA